MFAKTTTFAPLLSSPDWKAVFHQNGLPLDQIGILRCLETIAFPGTKVEILEKLPFGICKVQTKEYSAPSLFIDERFLETAPENSPERSKVLPQTNVILESMIKAKGAAYIWGGNRLKGIPEMLSFYPPPQNLSEKHKKIWSFEGVDCSGLLYEATNGITPRNTSELLHYGEGIDIEGLSSNEIIKKARPLDYIIWKGHIIFFLDERTLIESNHSKGGVVILDAKERLEEIFTTKTTGAKETTVYLSSDRFFLRRWI